MPTSSILSILVYSQSGYLLVYHMGLSLVHCSYLSVGSLHAYISHFILFSFSKPSVDFLSFSGILLCRIFFFNFSGINWLSYIFSIGIILFGPIWLRID